MLSIFSRFSKLYLLPPQTAFVALKKNRLFSEQYERQLQFFKKAVQHRKSRLKGLALEVSEHYKISSSSDDAVSFAYDKEYSGYQPNYSYLSPVLLPLGFEIITGYNLRDASTLMILDVGAGSNEFLRFCHSVLKIPKTNLSGGDISHASINIIKSDGFNGYLGRLEQLPLLPNSFDLIFLSYFIDYDTDQASTFKSAVELVRSGGKIILEGWFPVRPFALLPSDKGSFTFITKGKNKFEDSMLIFNFIQEVCVLRGYTIEFEQVCEGTRYVYSRYGFQKLPSWFLTLRIKK